VERARREELHRQMARLADGDRAVFQPIYETLWPVLRRFAERAVGPTYGEDAAQAALLRVFSQAAEFDVERDALSWVVGIASFECRTLRQKIRRRKEDPGEVPEGLSPDNPEERVMARELEAAAAEVLGALGPQDVETIRLVVSGQRPAGATFRKRVERALGRLRAAWSAKHGTE
jgi:DNA-directed RNA polymerase specialized sigma24 family protein